MSQCNGCLNALPALSACSKKPADWLWPQDYECIMKMDAFPAAIDCEWSMELIPGGAIFLQGEPGGIRREK